MTTLHSTLFTLGAGKSGLSFYTTQRDAAEGRMQDLIETAKAHIRSKVEHPFRVIKQQFGFQKTRLRGLAKLRCKISVLAALTNLLLARRQLLATG